MYVHVFTKKQNIETRNSLKKQRPRRTKTDAIEIKLYIFLQLNSSARDAALIEIIIVLVM